MHLIIDGYGGDISKMWDMETVRSFLTEYPDNLGMTPVSYTHLTLPTKA